MDKFNYFPTPHFRDRLERIEKSDPSGHARILTVIDRLLQRPKDADGWMHGTHHGRLKKYVGRRDYRLIYHWCHLCRKEDKRLEDQCGYCPQVPDDAVIFFDVYHKNEIKRL
ncbi:MAG: toxin [Desulfuromonadales bacterium]